MNINKSCNFFLRDLYSYDISSCHYSILQKHGFDISKLDKNNKESRNVEIGKMMKDNPRITSLLRLTTESVINEYLSRNNIKDDNVIVRQYDGIITNKSLKDLSGFLDLEFKTAFQVFIISIDRNKYIATNGRSETIKGVSYRYNGIDSIYKKILRINFLSKESIFKSLQEIKDEILTSDNSLLYCIPSQDKYNVIFKEYGQMEIAKQLSDVLDCNDIDREWYWNKYIEPFTKSITFEFLKGGEK